jgi:uncharacterized protein YbjT (DUF2867 family)
MPLVTVFGGTGFLGRRVVGRLRAGQGPSATELIPGNVLLDGLFGVTVHELPATANALARADVPVADGSHAVAMLE